MAEQIGQVGVVYGEARAEGPAGARVLEVGSPVYADDAVTTGGDGAVEITFLDGAVLSQGADSKVVLDEYVYDPDKGAAQFAVEMLHGTFRSVTGKIVDIHPENFEVKTPLSIIGIRGTTTAHHIEPGGREMHAVIDFDGKPVVVTSRVTGQVDSMVEDSLKIVSTDHGLGDVHPLSLDEFIMFESLSPDSLREGPPEMHLFDDFFGHDAVGGAEGLFFGDGDFGDDGGPHEGLSLYPAEAVHVTPIDEPLLPPSIETTDMEFAEIEPPHSPSFAAGSDDDPVMEDEEEPVTVADLSGRTTPTTVDLTATPPHYFETATPGTTFGLGAGVTSIVGSTTASTTIFGNDADNRFTGGSANDESHGGDGADTFVGSGGSDQFYGDGGFDWVDYSDQSQKINLALGGAVTKDAGGTDTLANIEGVYGTAYDDTLSGDNNSNVIYGNGGADLLWGGTGGEDSLYGGDGGDAFRISEDASAGDKIFGGAGYDEIIVWHGGTYDISLMDSFEGVEAIRFETGYDGGGITIAKNDTTNSFWTSGTVDGNSAGAAESLTVNIGAGGGNAFDASQLTFTDWDIDFNQVFTNGTGGDDTITGFAGQDVINGNGGNDLLIGSDRYDILNGGDGDDVFRFGSDPGSGWMGQTEIDGGNDTDRLQVTGDVNFTSLGRLDNVEEIEVTANHSAEFSADKATGESWKLFGDTGGSETVQITQAAGDSTDLTGFTFDGSWTAGQDSLVIATNDGGSETVVGSDFGERILGSQGSDVLTGNGGNDIFVYQSSTQWTDTINGFTTDEDKLHLETASVGNLAVGSLDAARFASTTDAAGYTATGSAAGMTADTRFVLVDNAVGNDQLYYDADGSGAGAGQLVASFDDTSSIDHDDITIYHV